MAGVGLPITALEYNNTRGSIAAKAGDFNTWSEHGLGSSTTSSGYGRNFTSNLVVGGSTFGVSDSVTEQQHFDLWLDLQAAYVHQYGSQYSGIQPTSFEGKLTYPNEADYTSRDYIEWAHYSNSGSNNDLRDIATAVNAFNHASTDFDSSSFTTAILRTSGGSSCTSSRNGATNPWGGSPDTITHRVEINFLNHNALLYFLSAGGEIRFDASLTGGTSGTSNTKDWDWKTILSAMGTIRFGRVAGNFRTESLSGSGTGSLLSSLSTGTSPSTLIFEKQGGVTTGNPSPGDPGGTTIYDDNAYQIYASTNTAFSSATKLIFEIRFDDADPGTGGQQGYPSEPDVGGVDENVTGNITSNIYTYTPSSTFIYDSTTYAAITQAAPTGSVTSSLV
tara:strand:- start:2876 stop:4048 length:1173 start_codon:yes stop_codon:yes gene_type:complete